MTERHLFAPLSWASDIGSPTASSFKQLLQHLYSAAHAVDPSLKERTKKKERAHNNSNYFLVVEPNRHPLRPSPKKNAPPAGIIETWGAFRIPRLHFHPPSPVYPLSYNSNRGRAVARRGGGGTTTRRRSACRKTPRVSPTHATASPRTCDRRPQPSTCRMSRPWSSTRLKTTRTRESPPPPSQKPLWEERKERGSKNAEDSRQMNRDGRASGRVVQHPIDPTSQRMYRPNQGRQTILPSSPPSVKTHKTNQTVCASTSVFRL